MAIIGQAPLSCFPYRYIFEPKMGLLRHKNRHLFELMPELTVFYLGPTPVFLRLEKLCEEDYCLMSRNAWVYFMEKDREFLQSKR